MFGWKWGWKCRKNMYVWADCELKTFLAVRHSQPLPTVSIMSLFKCKCFLVLNTLKSTHCSIKDKNTVICLQQSCFIDLLLSIQLKEKDANTHFDAVCLMQYSYFTLLNSLYSFHRAQKGWCVTWTNDDNRVMHNNKKSLNLLKTWKPNVFCHYFTISIHSFQGFYAYV